MREKVVSLIISLNCAVLRIKEGFSGFSKSGAFLRIKLRRFLLLRGLSKIKIDYFLRSSSGSHF